MTDRDHDLLVVGSGPAVQKAAINAAKLGKRVAVIEREGMVGSRLSTAARSRVKPSGVRREILQFPLTASA